MFWLCCVGVWDLLFFQVEGAGAGASSVQGTLAVLRRKVWPRHFQGTCYLTSEGAL